MTSGVCVKTELTEAMTFETLYREHYERIYRFAFRMLGSAEEAKDTVQDTFVKLHDVLSGDTRIRQPRTWLYTVAANFCRNSLKRETHFRDVVRKQIEDKHIEQSAEANLINEERIKLMRQAIGTLPDRDRTLLMLYQDHLPYAEIAQVIGVRTSSVGKLLSRAIDKLVRAGRNGNRP
jgi:RNA polymerase sigma-70 factor (ECF subfamily)